VSYIRRLPSGKWQATVRGPDGRKHTRTDPLKSAARRWAAEQEALLARREFRDPRLGEVKAGDWHDRVARARPPSAKNAGLWRTHCEPAWAGWPMAAITRMDAQAWVERLQATPVARYRGKPAAGQDDVPLLSAETVHAIVHVMSSLYRLAIEETPPLVTINPFAKLDLPRIPPRPADFLEHAEAEALYAAAGAIDPRWRALVELGTQVGLRPGELYGLHGHRVDWLRATIEVIDVLTDDGLRQWPKSKRSHRVVPVPPDTLEGMSALMVGRPRESLVFTGRRGAPVNRSNFASDVWYPAVEAAGIRRFPPRIMRHTAASWLVLDGTDLYRVQALLGHESFATTQRYAHLATDTWHDKIRESWTRQRDAR
jgi:integrase